MNQHLNNKIKKSKRNYLSSGNFYKIRKFKGRILILFTIILFSLVSIIDWPANTNINSEDSQIPIEKNLELSNGGDKIFKFKLAIDDNPNTIDPHNTWDTTSNAVIDQVCEGLFKYNLSAPDHAIIPNLAISNGTWSLDSLNYTVPLRTGVTFHDGFGFKAIDVKESFNRLQYFINASGNLPSNTSVAVMDSIYKFLDGTPIINRTEIINDYLIKFVLNRPYGAFQSLLCYESSYIISTNSTPKYKYIEKATEDLVGTGPFVYDGFTQDVEVRFHAFDNYWNGKPDIELLYFKIMGFDRNYAILNGSIDYITDFDISMLPDFNANPDVKVVDNGNSLVFYYLSMNNQKINKTFRQAISYAINYSYFIDNIEQGYAERAKSPVPPGVSYSNWTNNYATFNVTKAREIMQSMGFGIGWDTTFLGSSEANWASASFASYNYSYMTSRQSHSDRYTLLHDNLDKIGIEVIDGGTDDNWYIKLFFGTSPGGYNDLDLILSGWGPDFNDASNMINPLFSNNSAANRALTNDPNLQNLMAQGLNETNPNARKVIYNEIQKYLVEDLMPVAFLYVPQNFDVYRNYIVGYQSNKWDKVWLHGVTQNCSLAPQKIHINGNEEWTYFRNAEKCTGAGTYSDPYVIEDLVIDGKNYSSGILIENTNVYFKIENCTVYNSGENWAESGIGLVFTNNGKLINNNCSFNNNNGISIGNLCQNNTVINNTANNNRESGIVLAHNKNNTVSGNVGSNNGALGIGFFNSSCIIISRNTANNNSQYGIRLWGTGSGSENNTVSRNTAISNGNYGIYLTNINNTLVIGNNLKFNGLGGYLDINGNNNEFSWNVNNGIADPFIIDDTGGGNFTWAQAENQLAWVTGSGIYSDPYIIEDLIIDGKNSGSGIFIENSNVYFRIENCTVYNAGAVWYEAGIRQQSVNNGKLFKNNVSNNNYDGIYLNDSNNNTVSGNTAENNEYGIVLEDSTDNMVSGNIVERNRMRGIFLSDSINNMISANTVNNNSFSGISLFPNSNNNTIMGNTVNNNYISGIILVSSYFNKVSGNNLINNSGSGMYLSNSDDNNVSGNNVTNNEGDGIYLYESNNNTVSGNTENYNNMGIFLNISDFNTISGNTANNNSINGLLLYQSNNNTISGNTVNSNSANGMYIDQSNHTKISGNTVYTNTQSGIRLGMSNNNTISGNTVYTNTQNGIILWKSNVSIISGNNVYSNDEVGIFSIMENNIEILGNTVNNNNWHGILLHYTSECTVMRNTANNNNYEGIKLENSNNVNVTGNILNSNGAPYIDYMGSNNDFLWNVANGYTTPIVFDDSGAGDFTWTEATDQLAWFSGSGTSSNPYLIENININSQNSGSCVEVINSNAYLIIRNSEFTNSGSGTSDAGIRLVYVTTATTELTNLNCSYNNGYGIYLSNCDNVHIEDCTISNNGDDGIALLNSDNNYIENNDDTINYNNGYGIYLSDSDSNEINGNYINYNDEYGISLSDSSNNNLNYNDLRYNIKGDYIVQGSSTGNTFGDGNDLDPVPGDDMFLIIVIAIVSIIALAAVIGGVALKKRSSKTKKAKEKKSELPLEERAALRILEERKQTEKQKQKADEKERKLENNLLKRMATIDFLIKENKIETALNSLVKIQEEAQDRGFTDIIKTSLERMDLCHNLQEEISKQEKLKEEERRLQEKLKEEERLERERLIEEEKKKKELLKEEERVEKERLEKEKERQRAIEDEAGIKEGFQKRISNADYLLKENKTETAINILLEIQKEAQDQGLEDIVNTTEEKIIECKKLELDTVNRIKQTVLNLGARFTRLQLIDISEKSGITDESLIESVIQDMIRNKEITGEYFSSSKALALDVIAPIPVEEKAAGKNVFISYSTLDTDYFQVSKIVRRLELYPEINRVIFWEADSQQNIVEFMEETLRITNAFILFCSENSFKSGAVKGEWQSAYQMVKKGLMKMIPVYENEDDIPRLLWNMLNVKFSKEDFEGFIQKLYEEIIR